MNTKPNHPKAENVVINDRNGAVACIVSDLTKAMRAELDRAMRTCLNCTHFFEKDELCRFNGTNQRPPARVIASGCPAHEDEIPF